MPVTPFKRLSRAVAVSMASEEEDGSDENEMSSAPSQTVVAVGALTLLLGENVVKPGSLLNIKVMIDRALPPISRLRMSIKGEAESHFLADDGKEYKAKEIILNENIDLVEQLHQAMAAASNESEIIIPYGYRVPQHVLPSFKGSYGGVSYECAVILKSKKSARKRIQRVAFQVLPKLGKDLSMPASPIVLVCPPSPTTEEFKECSRSESSIKPDSYCHIHRVTSFGSTDGTVEITVCPEKTLLKRGQTKLRVLLRVTNKTKLKLWDLKFGILSTTQWNAKGRQLIEKKKVHEEFKDDIILKYSKPIQLENVFPPIPSNSPPSIEGNVQTSVCASTYTFYVKMIPPNFAGICLYEIPLKVY